MYIKDNAVILFQGDSITDCGRDRNDFKGTTGYNKMVENYIDTFYSHKNITVINRGISGNTVLDLKNRWEEDCIDLKPDCVLIMIGINDTWRKYDQNLDVSHEVFYDYYRHILNETKKKTNAEIMIIEPFLIHADPSKDVFREDLDFRIDVIRKLAREFKTNYIPLDGIFAEIQTKYKPEELAEDGIHPSTLGFTVIAKEIINRLTF